MVRPPGTKWLGASMWVPVWLPRVTWVRAQGLSAPIWARGTAWGSGSPGNTRAENTSRAMS